MRYRFKTEQSLPYSLEAVFAFFADPANLPRLMPAWQAARIDSTTLVPPSEAPQSTTIAGDGSTISLSLRPFPLSPLRLPWIAVIEDFRWLEGFCDVQQRGPFQYWRHCHSVHADGASTVLCDEVEYQVPFGPLGSLAHTLILRRQIESTFHYRQQRTLELLAQQAH
jgi:ligand-binding SRPBCC domain-containing protein